SARASPVQGRRRVSWMSADGGLCKDVAVEALPEGQPGVGRGTRAGRYALTVRLRAGRLLHRLGQPGAVALFSFEMHLEEHQVVGGEGLVFRQSWVEVTELRRRGDLDCHLRAERREVVRLDEQAL